MSQDTKELNELEIRKGRALIIDDSPSIRRVLSKILISLGFNYIIEAENGQKGIEQLEQIGTAAVTMVDWNMPVMNGYDFVCNVRTNHKYDDMPIIVVTTVTEQHQMIKVLQAGANEFVMKPFTKDAIIDKLTILGISVNRS